MINIATKIWLGTLALGLLTIAAARIMLKWKTRAKKEPPLMDRRR